jgi:hypothetical protein
MKRMAALLLAMACVAAARPARAAAAAPTVVDAFESAAPWSPVPASGVLMKLSSEAGARGRSLRIDFDFQKGGGYAVAHRQLALELPDNYRFAFRVRGLTAPQNLEFKLIDSSGANVWWVNTRDFAFARDWQTVTYKKRHITFAWGPAGGGELRRVAAIEFAITAGSGGKGTVWLDELTLEPLPGALAAWPPPVATASSGLAGSVRGAAADSVGAWTPNAGDRAPWLALDFGAERELGGIVVSWTPGRHATDYVVELAGADGEWRAVRTVLGGNGGRDPLDLPETETRRLRVRVLRAAAPEGVAIHGIAVRPLAWAATPAAFLGAVAADAPRGRYPRGMHGEQAYWTVLGVDGAKEEALLGEDGALETGKARFAVEPFLKVGERLFGWADVRSVASLEDGDLPIPSVRWEGAPLELTVTAVAAGTPERSAAWARYRVRNPGPGRRSGTLYLALRPFQVNPPPQFLNMPGGVAPLRSLERRGAAVVANGTQGITSLTPPDGFGATRFDAGEIVEHLAAGALPPAAAVFDDDARGSGALAYAFDLAPGATHDVVIVAPLAQPPDSTAGLSDAAAASRAFDARIAEVKTAWRTRLDRVTIDVPDPEVAQSVRAQIGWILVNRDGAAIQPGSRSYERSWIRDGTLTSVALLRLGHEDAVKAFLEWFAPFQYGDGKVPCCVDHRGSDPVPEHDSHGEFIHLVAEYLRLSGDRELPARMWPHARAAAAYLDTLRAQRRTAEWRTPANAPFFGILPPSISHEGYSAKPMHSYWDDLWALRGYKDAVWLAEALGHHEDLAWLTAARDTFARDLAASVRAAMAAHRIDFVPGCADLGDADATSTTIAFDPVQAGDVLPADGVRRSFAGYMEWFAGRASGSQRWDAFTPYEWRTVGALTWLGQRAQADSVLTWLMGFRRPAGFRHWAEVADSAVRRPRFIGDMPHTWCGSDFARSVMTMLAYERESDSALVIGAGVPFRWVEGTGITVRGLRTRWGPLAYTMRGTADEITVRLEAGDLRLPPGGVVVTPPTAPGWTLREVIGARGRRVKRDADGTVRVVQVLPVTLRWKYHPPSGR